MRPYEPQDVNRLTVQRGSRLSRARLRKVIVGALLLIIGISVIAIRTHWLAQLHFVPVNAAVSGASVRTNDFQIDVPYEYLIELTFQSAQPDSAVECLLNMYPSRGSCAVRDSVLQVEWQLYADSKLLKTKAVKRPSCYESGEFHCIVGSFEGKRGQVYVAQVDIGESSAQLNWINPHVLIEPHREFHEDWGATYLFVEPLAGICTATGAWLIVSWLFGRDTPGAPGFGVFEKWGKRR